jgi:hypothetical protein
MPANLKSRSVLAVLVCVVLGTSASVTSAATADVAKKCQALTAQAYPPAVPGNPAAGTATGTGTAARKYYSDCVAHGGNASAAPDPTTADAGPAAAADSGGREHKAEHGYQPCPASVAFHGRNVCLGLK